MTTNQTVTATFTASPSSATLTVTKAGAGTGTVTSSPAGINCGTDCSNAYNHRHDRDPDRVAAERIGLCGLERSL